MATLQWSEELALDLPRMDETHQEFVQLLQAVQAADDAGLPAAWQALVEHTAEHFAQEDRWMQATQFAAGSCHSLQHQAVLNIMREGGAQGDLRVLRTMAEELTVWFPQHTDSMDAALAAHLRRVGFDPATGVVHQPAALPAEPIHGCGGACSSGEAEAEREAEAAPA